MDIEDRVSNIISRAQYLLCKFLNFIKTIVVLNVKSVIITINPVFSLGKVVCGRGGDFDPI